MLKDIFIISKKHIWIFKNIYFKVREKGNENNFNDYRKEDEEKKEKYINEKLGKLPTHRLKKQLKLDELLWDFDAVSLYSSAIWDENSVYPEIETGYAYTEAMNDEFVEKFNTRIFTQGSAL